MWKKTIVQKWDVEIFNIWCIYLSSLVNSHSFLHLRERINLKKTETMLSTLIIISYAADALQLHMHAVCQVSWKSVFNKPLQQHMLPSRLWLGVCIYPIIAGTLPSGLVSSSVRLIGAPSSSIIILPQNPEDTGVWKQCKIRVKFV